MAFYNGPEVGIALRLVQLKDGRWYARSKNIWFPIDKTPIGALKKATTFIRNNEINN